MRLAGINPTSLFDGVGVNFVVFFQGCEHRCPHCHNPSTWALDGGIDMPFEKLRAEIEKYLPLITGITLSGGDPVYQLDSALEIACWAKSVGLTVTLYTGFEFRQLTNMPLTDFDYIIDGRFVKEQASGNIPFRGSRNQRIWYHTPQGWEVVL